MSKNFFQDVVPPDRRSIRNVPIMGSRRRREAPSYDEQAKREEIQPSTNEMPSDQIEEYSRPAFIEEKKKKFMSPKVFVSIAIVLVAVFVFAMMTAFTSAKINIVPKRENVSFNTAIKATKSLVGEDGVKFEVIDIKKEGQIEVPAEGEEMAEKKASGTIVVYNNFSSETQRLITRTRFETKEGLVYRIAESITVPGKTAVGPGTIEVEVFADEPGPKYNIDKTDFTLPGFKSDAPRYKGFYAKSKTNMEGGFVGKVKKINSNDKETYTTTLEESMRKDLDKDAETKIPADMTLLKGATLYEFRDLGQAENSTKSALLKLEATAHVVVFSKRSLSSTIAKQFLPAWQNIPVEIRSFDDMIVSFEPGINLRADTIPFKLSGTAFIFAAINSVEVTDGLKGMPKNDLNTIMANFEGVLSAKATVRPLWKNNFPDDPSKIHIVIE